MRQRYAYILLVLFLTFVGCRSSLFSFCSGFFQPEVSGVSLPSCHNAENANIPSEAKSTPLPKAGTCVCPMSFDELVQSEVSLSKFIMESSVVLLPTLEPSRSPRTLVVLGTVFFAGSPPPDILHLKTIRLLI
ncbi:hypothetical protein P3G55_08415 [Leptospira sp. 96542]|nr:hypothetical protein [Leptospira sp. 96542]